MNDEVRFLIFPREPEIKERKNANVGETLVESSLWSSMHSCDKVLVYALEEHIKVK